MVYGHGLTSHRLILSSGSTGSQTTLACALAWVTQGRSFVPGASAATNYSYARPMIAPLGEWNDVKCVDTRLPVCQAIVIPNITTMATTVPTTATDENGTVVTVTTEALNTTTTTEAPSGKIYCHFGDQYAQLWLVDWLQFDDCEFRHYPQQLSWFNAEAFCRNHSGIVTLASVESFEAMMFIFNTVVEAEDDTLFWLGGATYDETFGWSDGSDFNFTYFLKGEPSQSTRGEPEGCIQSGHLRYSDFVCLY